MVHFSRRYRINALFYLLTILITFSAKSDAFQDTKKLVKLSNNIPYYHIQSQGNISRFAIFVKAGHLYNHGNSGVSHLVEHLFNLGGGQGNLSGVDEFLAKVGGKRIAITNTSGVRYWYEFPTKNEEEFIHIFSNLLSSINLSDEALKAQISAIDNEWKQGQKHIELMNWEQTFNVFAKNNVGSTFFMGNAGEFELQAQDLKKTIRQNFARYIPENIFILTESPNSLEASFKQLNKTIGKLSFDSSLTKRQMLKEPKLVIDSITETNKVESSRGYQVQFHFAIPTISSDSSLQAEFLIHLFEKSKINLTNTYNEMHSFQLSSSTFIPNAYHNFDSLNLIFSNVSGNELDLNESAKYLLAMVQQFLSNLTQTENAVSLANAYIEYEELRAKSCKDNDLSNESVKKLDNSIHFGALDSWVNYCNLNREFNQTTFDEFIQSVKSSKLYTKLLIPEKNWNNTSVKTQKMDYYERQFILSEAIKPIPERVVNSVNFPTRNRYLDVIDSRIAPSEKVETLSAGDGSYAINKVLTKRIESLDDYVEVLVFKAFLEDKYQSHIIDAKEIATSAKFIIDSELRLVTVGDKSVANQLANDINVPSQLSDDEFLFAKTKAIKSFKNALADNQVFRMNSLLNRIQLKQTWSDKQILNALHNFKQGKINKPNNKNIEPEPLNIELLNNAPVNILTSLRQVNEDSIENKLYAILLNSMIQSDYKNRFRNELKIAYTAVTNFQFSNHGTGIVTLLQTSTHSIDDMKTLNQTFFSEMLKKIKHLNKQEFEPLIKDKFEEIYRLSENIDYVFTDTNLKRIKNTNKQSIDYSIERYVAFAEALLSTNKNERYIAFKGF